MVIFRVLLILAAGVVLVVSSANKPDASTCHFINNLNRGLGGPATCHSGPSHAEIVWAIVLAASGAVLLLARYVRGHQ